MDNFDDNAIDGEIVEAATAAFAEVYACQAELQDLLDGGGEADESPEDSIAAIKAAGQKLLDAINDLSIADFEAEFETESLDDSALDAIFVGAE